MEDFGLETQTEEFYLSHSNQIFDTQKTPMSNFPLWSTLKEAGGVNKHHKGNKASVLK